MPSILADWLQALAATAPAAFFRDSTIGYATLNAAHIFSIALIVGAIAALDFRMLGLFNRIPLAALASPLSRVAAAGVFCAVTTGFLLFSVRPLAYAQNPAFLAKISLVALGILNALALRTTRSWALSVETDIVADSVRAAALRSLLIWAGAILAGRWIGFLQ